MHFRRERVRIQTPRHEIEATLQLPNEGFRSRTSDFLNAHEREFLALTDAVVRPLDGTGTAERHAFVALAVRHVVMVVELESLDVIDDTGAPPEPPHVLAVSTPPPAADVPGGFAGAPPKASRAAVPTEGVR